MKRFFVTRPIEDSISTAQALAAREHDAVIVPLLTISYDAEVTFTDIEPQGLLISSGNGIRAFAKCDARRDLDVLTVGPASAEEARALGFRSVTAAGGDVASLVKQAAQRYRPDQGVLCHVAGRAVAGQLAPDLRDLGFDVIQRRAYAANPVAVLPEDLRQFLSAPDGDIACILLYSRRTTQCFADLVVPAELVDGCRRLAAFCLSDAAAAPLMDLEMKSVAVSAQKTESALLDLCDME